MVRRLKKLVVTVRAAPCGCSSERMQRPTSFNRTSGVQCVMLVKGAPARVRAVPTIFVAIRQRSFSLHELLMPEGAERFAL